MYDGGSDVSGYVVEILEEGSEQWYRATAKALKTNEYVAAGLAANKKYRFRVAAVNSNGTGEFSDPSVEIEPMERIGESSVKLYSKSIKEFLFFNTTIIARPNKNIWQREQQRAAS